MNSVFLDLVLLTYCLVFRLVLRNFTGQCRERLLAGCNLLAFWLCFYRGVGNPYNDFVLVAYLVLVVFQYLIFRFFAKKSGWLPWLAFYAPIVFLCFAHYVGLIGLLNWAKQLGLIRLMDPQPMEFVGLSYMAFRCSRLVLEVRNNSVACPGFWEYVNFSFFIPTMPLGPINTYANYRRGFDATPWRVPIGRAVLRILV